MSRLINQKCLILFSGGQDSTTCLYWAKTNFQEVSTLNIQYGQRHAVEIEAAKKIARLADVPYHNFSTNLFQQIGGSVLLGEGDISTPHKIAGNLPSSFVPGRNILFLTIAAAFAYKHQIPNIVTGVCETDYSGYPDCREETINALETTLSLGMEYPFKIHTPLMDKSKKETVEMAMRFPGCMEALAYSHTCYEGKIPPCRVCPACKLREKGFLETGISDPLIERLYVEKN